MTRSSNVRIVFIGLFCCLLVALSVKVNLHILQDDERSNLAGGVPVQSSQMEPGLRFEEPEPNVREIGGLDHEGWFFEKLTGQHALYRHSDGREARAAPDRFIVSLNDPRFEDVSTVSVTLPGFYRESFRVKQIPRTSNSVGVLFVGREYYQRIAKSFDLQDFPIKPDWIIKRTLNPIRVKSLSEARLSNSGTGEGFNSSWHFEMSGVDGYTVQDLSGANPILVGVIDSGIDTEHPQLASQIFVNTGEIPGNGIDDDENGYIDDVNGWNFFDDNNDVSDSNIHGTHVSGIIAARALTPEEEATFPYVPAPASPAAPYVKLLPLKVFGPNDESYSSSFVEALSYADLFDVDILNHSWGASYLELEIERELKRISQEKGVIHIAAAGNDSLDLGAWGVDQFPAEYDNNYVLAVAAHEDDGSLSSFSNYGGGTDLMAPGGFIHSTAPLTLSQEYVDMGFSPGSLLIEGTSMAAPVATASVALFLRNNQFLRHTSGSLISYYLDNFCKPLNLGFPGDKILNQLSIDPPGLIVVKPAKRLVYHREFRQKTSYPFDSYQQEMHVFIDTYRTGNELEESYITTEFVGDYPELASEVFVPLPASMKIPTGERVRNIALKTIIPGDFETDPVIPHNYNFPFELEVQSDEYEVYNNNFEGFLKRPNLIHYLGEMKGFDMDYVSVDSDYDGLPNGLEAEFGLDLNIPDSAQLSRNLRVELSHTGSIYSPRWRIEVGYISKADGSGVRDSLYNHWGGGLRVQTSIDLVNWEDIPEETSLYNRGTDQTYSPDRPLGWNYDYYLIEPHWTDFNPVTPEKFFVRFRYEQPE